MISKYRSSSIPTVHFKRLLSLVPSPSTTPSQPTKNGEKNDPSQEFHESTPLGRLTESFCSNALLTSAKRGSPFEGKQIHSHLCKLGYHNTLSLQNQLLNVYVKCKELCDAQRVFDEMLQRNVVTWNTMICGGFESGRNGKPSFYLGFLYFKRMMLEMVGPNHITFNGLLRFCVELNDIEVGKQLHSSIVKWGCHLDCFVNSALVDLYGKFAMVEDARCVFEQAVYRDLVLWNVMVSCYALNYMGSEGFRFFNLMRSEGGMGDNFTHTSLLSAFSKPGFCELGKQIHSLVIRLSFDIDVLVGSALVDMYAKNENIDDARKAFDEMTVRNVVSWTTIIVSYGRNGDGKEALKLLKKMFKEDFKPDELTLASILSSCANLSGTSEVEQLHAYVIKNALQEHSSVANALINAYSKCGSIAKALTSFTSISKPDVVTWTSIIGAYAFNGLPKESILIFEKMLSNDMRPDKIAFLGILSACSHGGLVSEGLCYFNSMITEYQIMPDSEHYTCIVDLLGRAGFLYEAFDVLNSMPIEPEQNTLGAFLGACKIHGNVELAKWASEKLSRLEPSKPVNYTLMSNLYACAGHWLDVARMRKVMRDRCDYKIPGCSWLEIAGEVHTFVSSDESHPQAVEVYAMLRTLVRLMKEEYNDSSKGILLGSLCDKNLLNSDFRFLLQ